MEYIKVKCPNCGKKLLSYYPGEQRYGSPLKTCKRCREKYLDPRYHEIAIDGIAKDSMSPAKGVIMLICGVLFVWRGISLSHMRMLNTPDEAQWVFPAAILLMGAVLVLWGIGDIIFTLTGIKAKKYEKLRQESEERMQDYNYALFLKNSGYPVPEKYL